jgi:hypothetical protein
MELAVTIIGAVVGLGTILGWFLKIHATLRDEIGELREDVHGLRLIDAAQELKIETCWQFVMDNAKLAAAHKGLGTLNTPLNINDRAREIFERAGFTARLKQWYLTQGITLTPLELEMEVTRLFRPEMITTICLPHGLAEGECVALAVEIAKEAAKENCS